MNLLGQIEILESQCNLSTIFDGRGGIFSWVPKDAIKDFTLLYFNPGKTRGNHYHPEFVEYFLVISGSLTLVTYDSVDKKFKHQLIGPGFCFRTPINVSHAVHAITPATCISLISKPWNECEVPIVQQAILGNES